MSPKNSPSIRALSCAALVLIAVAAGALGWAIWQLRVDVQHDVDQENGNLATLLAGQLSQFMQTIEIALIETRNDLNGMVLAERKNPTNVLSAKPTYDKLVQRLSRLPHAFNIAATDAAGNVIVSTAAWPAPEVNVADRDYFQRSRDHEGDKLTISSPLRNRINGQVSIIFARSMQDENGKFAGISYISVNVSYFEIIYKSIRSIADRTFLLVSTDGPVLVRYPTLEHVSNQSIPNVSRWYETIEKGGGSFRSPGAFGGQVRLASVRLVDGFPLAVSVSTLEASAFAEWRRRATLIALGAILFVGCSLYLLLAVNREMGRLRTSEAALRERSHSLEQSIAERAAMESRLVQAQKLESVGLLTGGLAHDFNNLLLVVIGNLDLVKDMTPEDSPQRELIDTSLTAALSGSELSNSLLAFSRQNSLKIEQFDLQAAICDHIQLLKRAVGRSVTLLPMLTGGPLNIAGDAAQLRCALTNLVINARDAMPDGGTITIRTYLATLPDADAGETPAGDYAVMEVADTGSGIPPELVDRIFDPFFTTKEVGKGTGLGLSMVYGFVTAMKGRIEVSGAPRGGTVFRLYLPLVTEEPTVVAPSLAPDLDPVPTGSRQRTIMVVDDDPMVRKSVLNQLKALGYSTIEVETPAEALEAIARKEPFDLLFSDIVMPGEIDGVVLARLAREQGVKVLLTSGYPDRKTSQQTDTLVEFRILKKPYRRAELSQAISEALAAA